MITEQSKLVAVITINYNQAAMTIECVNSILESTYDNFKICLIDNGSEKEDYEKLTATYDNNPTVSVLRIEKNCGYVGGVNHGLKNASKHDPGYYIIMNNDTIIDKDAIKELVTTAKEHNNTSIVTGTVLDFETPDIIQTTGTMFTDKRYLKERYPHRLENINHAELKTEERDMIDDIFWLIPKKIFSETGYYPNCYFLYAEQADYALNAVKKGFKLIYTPTAKLWHKGSLTTGGGDKQAPHVIFWRNKSGTIYLFRNIKRFHFFVYITKSLFKKTIKSIIALTQQQKPNDAYIAMVGVFYGIGWIIHRKPDNGYNPFLKE